MILNALPMHQVHLHDIANIQDKKAYISSLKQGSILECSFLYESNFQNAKLLRDITDAICLEVGMTSKWKTRMVLIVDEMNNNAIEYGSQNGDINELYIYIEELENILKVHIFVQDAGTWEHSKSAVEMEELRKQRVSKWFSDHNSIRGRWLFMIISNLVDTLYFGDSDSGWLKVGVMKDLHLEEK